MLVVRVAEALLACLVLACTPHHGNPPPDASQLAAVETYIKAFNTSAGDFFGDSVALAADGNVLVVGAPDETSSATGESSLATGIDGDQSDNDAPYAGAVYVFTRSATIWQQQAYIKASNTDSFDAFGSGVSLSADGNTLAVGAFGEASSAPGIDGNQDDNSARASGAVYVFTREGAAWNQQAYIKASDAKAGADFGIPVSVSADGNTLAVGADHVVTLATTAPLPAEAYVFSRSGSTWVQQSMLVSPVVDDEFGSEVALSDDGTELAVGAWRDDSGAVAVNGDPSTPGEPNSGAVYVFGQGAMGWTQQAFIKASHSRANGYFGYWLSLSPDGGRLAVGALGDSSDATGINGDELNDSATLAGAAYLYAEAGGTWVQQAYVKASNTDAQDCFGVVALSADSSQLVVGAPGESSFATGVDGNQMDNSASDSGAVFAIEISSSRLGTR